MALAAARVLRLVVSAVLVLSAAVVPVAGPRLSTPGARPVVTSTTLLSGVVSHPGDSIGDPFGESPVVGAPLAPAAVAALAVLVLAPPARALPASGSVLLVLALLASLLAAPLGPPTDLAVLGAATVLPAPSGLRSPDVLGLPTALSAVLPGSLALSREPAALLSIGGPIAPHPGDCVPDTVGQAPSLLLPSLFSLPVASLSVLLSLPTPCAPASLLVLVATAELLAALSPSLPQFGPAVVAHATAVAPLPSAAL